ncbi:unnamed protein product, partial [Cochlearia groenlandica]
MTYEQGNVSNPFRRRSRRVFAPKLLNALRRSRPSSESPANHLSRRWRATSSQKVYSLKLYDALRRSRRSTTTTIRDTANKVLAATARGSTRWSRAILMSRLAPSRQRCLKPVVRRRRKLTAVRNQVRVLGGLVPGCRRTALPELLDETADYIAALEMQVRAMKALSKILSEFKPSDKLGSLT